ncbi:MAG: hypothetical protein WAV05_00735 [Anaerolineales bacterium]
MNCPYCGQENPETNEVCDFCGGSLKEDTEKPIHEALSSEVVGIEQPLLQDQSSQPELIQSTPVVKGGIYGNKIWWFIGCFVLLCLVLSCVAVGWGAYRFVSDSGLFNPATLTPMSNISVTPYPTPATSKLLFFDDFSDPNSGWDRVDDSDYSTNYFDNAYRITVNTDMYDSWANPKNNTYGGAAIEVDATKNSGPDDNDFGVICRYQDSDHFYYAIISSDGYFGIIKVSTESSGVIGRDYLEYSDYINQGYATNHLRFECFGESLSFYVNGQLLDQQTDGDYTSGNAGLIAGTYDTVGTDILFDNFSVFTP